MYVQYKTTTSLTENPPRTDNSYRLSIQRFAKFHSLKYPSLSRENFSDTNVALFLDDAGVWSSFHVSCEKTYCAALRSQFQIYVALRATGKLVVPILGRQISNLRKLSTLLWTCRLMIRKTALIVQLLFSQFLLLYVLRTAVESFVIVCLILIQALLVCIGAD